MTLLARALAVDPATPRHILAELVTAPTTANDPYVQDLLTVHPTLTDADLGPVDRGPVDRDWYDRFLEPYPDSLHHALHQPHTTARTRARLLARTPTAILLSYALLNQPTHPDALTTLADRPPTGVRDLDLRTDAFLAVHPATPTGRAVTALSACLAAPRYAAGPIADTWACGLSDLGALATTTALRHPDALSQLASVAAERRTRVLLRRYATAQAAGDNPYAGVIATTLAAAATADAAGGAVQVRAWQTAVRHTGDLTVADRGLDVGGDTATEVASLVLAHPAYAGTPVRHRAAVLGATGTDPGAGTITTHAGERLATIRLDPRLDAAHLAATEVPATGDPDTTGALLAGLARVHHGEDLTQPVNPAAVAQTLPAHLLRYALHPALPEQHRRAAIAHFAGASTLTQRVAGDHYDNLAYVVAHAHPAHTLHGALLDMPLPRLRDVATDRTAAQDLLAHHPGAALRPYHQHLTGDATRTLLRLVDTFTGTTRELLTAVTAIVS